MEPTAQTPADDDRDEIDPIPRTPYKTGHPRWNLVIVLVIIGVILAFALIEAQRLSGINP